MNASAAYMQWASARWPSFHPNEFACRHCGELYIWPDFLDRLQSARDAIGRPFHILSGHRCAVHNALVGGAPLSQHLTLAADISLKTHTPKQLYRACKKAGFTGFGFYRTFLHVDMGRARQWYGSTQAKHIWQI